jgi:hypothetical protein
MHIRNLFHHNWKWKPREGDLPLYSVFVSMIITLTGKLFSRLDLKASAAAVPATMMLAGPSPTEGLLDEMV